MIVGAFGYMPFLVSSDKVMTFRNGKRTREAKFAVHEVIGRPDRIEPLKRGLDQVSLDITLSQNLGVVPAAMLILLNQYMDLQQCWPLFIGPVPLGEFVITKIGEDWKRHTQAGVIANADVSVEFLEDVDGALTARAKNLGSL